MIIIKYFWMYMLMGLVLNTTWAFGLSFYIMHRCKGDLELYDGALDKFIGFKGGFNWVKRFMEKNRPNFAMMVMIGYLVWPWNIAYGASKLPEVFDYIDEHLKTKTES